MTTKQKITDTLGRTGEGAFSLGASSGLAKQIVDVMIQTWPETFYGAWEDLLFSLVTILLGVPMLQGFRAFAKRNQ